MEATAQKNWWGRNWKWFVPVGCLSVLVLVAGFLALIVSIVFGVIRSSDVYQEALHRARQSPSVQAELGSPVEAGFLVMGEIKTQNTTGTARIEIPISGPKGSGTITAHAEKSANRWRYSLLEVGFKDSDRRVDLLKEQ